jgi:EXLDI family protein
MPNKTIYVSQADAPVFEQAQQIAGEALSSVIAKALREYVSRHQEKEKGMKEVAVKVGAKGSEREQRFVAADLGKWKGLSEDKEWRLEASIFRTQKGNWAVHLETKGRADWAKGKDWKDYVEDQRHAELIVAATAGEFAGKVPTALISHIDNLAEREKSPVDYLDI